MYGECMLTDGCSDTPHHSMSSKRTARLIVPMLVLPWLKLIEGQIHLRSSGGGRVEESWMPKPHTFYRAQKHVIYHDMSWHEKWNLVSRYLNHASLLLSVPFLHRNHWIPQNLAIHRAGIFPLKRSYREIYVFQGKRRSHKCMQILWNHRKNNQC